MGVYKPCMDACGLGPSLHKYLGHALFYYYYVLLLLLLLQYIYICSSIYKVDMYKYILTVHSVVALNR